MRRNLLSLSKRYFMFNKIGKSTCLSLLLRYYDPSSGDILINGHSIKEYDLKQLRQTIGIVSQEPVCYFLFFFF
jgi:ABC-type multidrug transport system fused ATPase/permease subunit